ncbi:serine/threonine protein kinase [Sorangium sp. So ce204]|uniref:serine/threonine protein kinase n=1 Tax=Sorangium sp. So ce204 TaxID=3133288 RepID=UPI003F6432C2
MTSPPPHFPYTIGETVAEGRGVAVYRAVRNADGHPVVLKVLDPRSCRPKDLDRLKREYETGKTLDVGTVVRPLALERYEGRLALVMEDSGAEPLDRLLGAPMAIGRFLDIAVRVAGAVSDIHQRGVVHRDLKPANILVNSTTGEVKIADLGLASRLPRDQQAAQPARLIEGSLPYISPEQTGRMNRGIDSRSDLYSLGVTFYQMLTGKLPIQARDPLEWIHGHIARAFAAPSDVVPEVPEAVARIVIKLLAKMPEERYQTARGLRCDLERCFELWTCRGSIEPFPLGEQDVSGRLEIPQKLYGRDEEIAALLGAFERVFDTGSPESAGSSCRICPESPSRSELSTSRISSITAPTSSPTHARGRRSAGSTSWQGSRQRLRSPSLRLAATWPRRHHCCPRTPGAHGTRTRSRSTWSSQNASTSPATSSGPTSWST